MQILKPITILLRGIDEELKSRIVTIIGRTVSDNSIPLTLTKHKSEDC